MENIYLIGFMGTGKSTVAREMSKLLPFRVVEMDDTIEMLAGKTIPEIFDEKGEEAFRVMETQFLAAISKEQNQIISCGGGIVLKEENITIMKNTGVVVLLEASVQTVFERVSRNDNRPLLKEKKSVEDIEMMMKKRLPLYEAAFDIRVKVDDKKPSEIASEVIKELALKGALH